MMNLVTSSDASNFPGNISWFGADRTQRLRFCTSQAPFSWLRGDTMRLVRRWAVLVVAGILGASGATGCEEGPKYHPKDGGPDADGTGGRGMGGVSAGVG